MQWTTPQCYAAKHVRPDVVAASRSGGVFSALSDKILAEMGVVYGCVLNQDLLAAHVRAETAEDRDRMRGSKYIQSDLGDTFHKVKIDLESGKKVLFTGTSCQVAGLRRYLGRDWENLLCVDIVCHGVPSPKVWQAYLRWQEEKHGSKVVSANFRDKTSAGWRAHVESLKLENGQVVTDDVFTTLLFGRCMLRPSCYECRYKSEMHPGDITIADYWGIEQVAPEFDDDKGVSLVLVNNPRGQQWLETIKESLRWKQTKLEDSLQPALVKPFPKPLRRKWFWRAFQKRRFDSVVQNFCYKNSFSILKRKSWTALQKFTGRT